MSSPWNNRKWRYGVVFFQKYFDMAYRSAVKNHYYNDNYNLSYPFGSIWGVRIPLEKLLFGVRLVNSTQPPPNVVKSSRVSRASSKIL